MTGTTLRGISSWAKVFLAASGENAQSSLECLKALVLPVKSVKNVFFGYDASKKLEVILRESVAAGGAASSVSASSGAHQSDAVEYAIRFLCLLVEKNKFKYIDLILPRIESMLNEKNGILEITIESASPLESDFTQELVNTVKEKTNARGVNIKTCIKPELLGGYLLRANGFYIDATLKGQVDKMITDLSRLDFNERVEEEYG
ncbi:MAG: ATP synthase F1 subunit delta [Treponema sp.]|jgi:ATP synthase F1 delta subunit|nr:ATP synthase F1 subunit delta [Treponema sp.]